MKGINSMSKIYVTGDTHKDLDINKLSFKSFPEGRNLTKEDYIIICGDLGLVWDGGKSDQYWQEWLNDKPWTTLFVDGNHENFDLLERYPIDTFCGGSVQYIQPSILHLMRGETFIINDKKIFTFGGAPSHDKNFRKEYVSWWKQEVPNFSELARGYNIIKDNSFDYIITHDWPASLIQRFYSFEKKEKQDDINVFFDALLEVPFERWYCGHHHCDINFRINNRNITCLYDDIVELGQQTARGDKVYEPLM